MRFPCFKVGDLFNNLGSTAELLHGSRNAEAIPAGVRPSIDVGCVLSTAADCLVQCGLDVPCLLECAPELAKCL